MAAPGLCLASYVRRHRGVVDTVQLSLWGMMISSLTLLGGRLLALGAMVALGYLGLPLGQTFNPAMLCTRRFLFSPSSFDFSHRTFSAAAAATSAPEAVTPTVKFSCGFGEMTT